MIDPGALSNPALSELEEEALLLVEGAYRDCNKDLADKFYGVCVRFCADVRRVNAGLMPLPPHSATLVAPGAR